MTRFLDVDFEETGDPPGVTVERPAEVDFDNAVAPAPLDGSQSLRITGASSSSYAKAYWPIGQTLTTCFVKIRIAVESPPASTNSDAVVLEDLTGSNQAKLIISNSVPRWRAQHGSVTGNGPSNLVGATVYDIWLDYVADSGAGDGTFTVTYGPAGVDKDDPGNSTFTRAGGNGGAVSRVSLEGRNRAYGYIIFDTFRVADTAADVEDSAGPGGIDLQGVSTVGADSSGQVVALVTAQGATTIGVTSSGQTESSIEAEGVTGTGVTSSGQMGVVVDLFGSTDVGVSSQGAIGPLPTIDFGGSSEVGATSAGSVGALVDFAAGGEVGVSAFGTFGLVVDFAGGSEIGVSAVGLLSVVDDLNPDAFGFMTKIGVPGNVVTSDPVTPVGYSAPAPTSVSGGQASINGGGFTATPPDISPGQSVTLRGVAVTGVQIVTFQAGTTIATFRISDGVSTAPDIDDEENIIMAEDLGDIRISGPEWVDVEAAYTAVGQTVDTARQRTFQLTSPGWVRIKQSTSAPSGILEGALLRFEGGDSKTTIAASTPGVTYAYASSGDVRINCIYVD